MIIASLLMGAMGLKEQARPHHDGDGYAKSEFLQLIQRSTQLRVCLIRGNPGSARCNRGSISRRAY